jgi:hypothetical protein
MTNDQKPTVPVVTVAWKGVNAAFKLYTLPDGRQYVNLPDGRRGYVTPRRDGTYILNE